MPARKKAQTSVVADDSKRLTMKISGDAAARLKFTAQSLGITQWDLLEVTLKKLDPKTDWLKREAEQIRARKAELRSKRKELRAKMRALTPEEMKRALEAVGIKT